MNWSTLQVILVVVGAVTFTVYNIWILSKLSYWKNMARLNQMKSDETFNAALKVERERQIMESAYVYLQQTITEMMKKPVIATLNDNQAGALIQAVLAFINANAYQDENGMPKERMN